MSGLTDKPAAVARSQTTPRRLVFLRLIDVAVFEKHGVGSTQVRHELGDLRHRVRLSFGDGFGARVKPAFGCAVGFHLFGDGFPVADLGWIHRRD